MRLIRKLHKWLGLVVGLQLLLWTLSGVVFAWLDHHRVSGEHLVRTPEAPILTSSTMVTQPAEWVPGSSNHLVEARLAPIVDQWVWRVEGSDGVTLRSAETGEVVQLEEDLVRRLATQHYAGAGQLVSVKFHPGATLETRASGATWEARFEDEPETTLYFSADDGRLVEVRNGSWRLFDFFWMLHTMDYKGRDNFNNPLVITVGMASLWLAVSGLLLLLRSFRREDFAFLTRWREAKPS